MGKYVNIFRNILKSIEKCERETCLKKSKNVSNFAAIFRKLLRHIEITFYKVLRNF